VVDHAGRLVCARCLAKALAAAAPAAKPRRSFAGVRRAATLAVSLLVLWFLFHAVGSMLLNVPPDLHEGTIWTRF
jgi:hypothetical protein